MPLEVEVGMQTLSGDRTVEVCFSPKIPQLCGQIFVPYPSSQGDHVESLCVLDVTVRGNALIVLIKFETLPEGNSWRN